MVPVKKVLDDAGMKPEEVDEIVLVGGSTRIPKVDFLLKVPKIIHTGSAS